MAPDAISFLRVDGEAKLVAILQNRVVGIPGGVENQALILAQDAVSSVTVLSYPDLGVNTEGAGDRCRNVTRCRRTPIWSAASSSPRGWRSSAAQKDPEAAIAAGMKVKPDMDHDLSLAQLKAGMTLMTSPHGADQPIGWMAAQDWAETLQLMKEYQDLKTDLPPTAFWTDAYLPK